MKTCMICGPYMAATDYEIHQNIEVARAVAIELWRMGFAVFCPHLNTAFFSGVVPEQQFKQGDIQWLKHADCVVMLPGWESSPGACVERDCAIILKIADFNWPMDREGLERFVNEVMINEVRNEVPII